MILTSKEIYNLLTRNPDEWRIMTEYVVHVKLKLMLEIDEGIFVFINQYELKQLNLNLFDKIRLFFYLRSIAKVERMEILRAKLME